ncbi:MAG: MurR/RpiR family transcriptional regulator, partial [Chloroflexi bacterium]
MEDSGLLLQIKGVLPALPEQERRLGEHVLRYPDEAADETIVGLARCAGVSNTTVSRFCRRLGFDGFRQFKVALAREWSRPSTLVYVQSQPGDTLATIANKILAANILALQDIQRSLDLVTLE